MSQTDVQQCIDDCLSCYRVCEQTLQHCLQKSGRHAAAEHIRWMADCAEICQVSAGFMLRGSDVHQHVCGVCAEICEGCARSCEEVNDDPQMQRCIDECHACAESCRHMAGVAA